MKLFQPGKIGSVEIKNRLVMAPMTINLEKGGFVTDEAIRFFEERARGGVGLIIVGDGIVDSPIGNNALLPVAIDDDKYLPMLKELNRSIQSHGARTCMQISHAGRRAGRLSKSGALEITGGRIPVAPSAIAHPATGYVVPRALSIEEIEDIIEKFGQATRRAIEAGFDIISLHCAHMYLCGQFISPWANQREDEYGGSFENRLRFPLQIIARMKREAGDHPVIARMNVQEPEGGNTLTDIGRIARELEKAGVDAIFPSVGFATPMKDPNLLPSVTAMRVPDACIMPMVAEIRKRVSVPIIAVNKIRDARMAEEILASNKASFIALGRPLLADPEFPNKSAEGRLDDITPCIYCNQCGHSVLTDNPLVCAVNPIVGREGKVVTKPAATPRRVIVIGGGPAGMEAAILATRRGHKVTLYEKDRQLGGQMLMAQKPPGKTSITRLIDYLTGRVNKLGIGVELGKELSPDDIVRLRPDAVIIATGGTVALPTIPGLEEKNRVTAWQVLRGEVETGQRVVIIGGGQTGLETAEYLAEQGRTVAVVEILDALATGMPEVERSPMLMSLERLGVKIMTKTRVERVSDGQVDVIHGTKRELLPADTVVLATGLKPNQEMATKLSKMVPELHLIGDALKPGRILDAMRDGFELGNRI